jgi:hypothetical protein
MQNLQEKLRTSQHYKDDTKNPVASPTNLKGVGKLIPLIRLWDGQLFPNIVDPDLSQVVSYTTRTLKKQ